MKSDEDEAFAGLRNAVVDGIEQLSAHPVLSGLREILQNLLLHAHLSHALHVLHHEDARLDLADDTHKFAVERVSWIVDEA